MKTYHIIVIFIVSLFFASCENFFETSIDLEVPEHESKLAVTTFIENQEFANSILVSYSIGGLENPTDNQLVNNAIITLQYDDEAINFSLTDSDGIYTPDFPISYAANTAYLLEVEAPTYESISATQTLPSSVPITEAHIDGNYLKVKFHDDLNQRNYYIIELASFQSGSWQSEWIYPFGDSSNMSVTKNGVIFNDDTINGSDVEMVINYEYYGDTDTPILYRVKLHSVTEDFYRYDRSLDLSYESGDNPFVEPIILHRNITNGYGIFAMGNVASYEFLTE